MKIIIVSILLTVQAQYIDDQSSTFILNDGTSTINLITQTMNQPITNEDKTILIESSSILNDLSDITKSSYQSETWSSLDSFSAKNDFDSTTITDEILFRKEQWFNVNQSNRGDSIFWRKINDGSLDGSTYILRSSGECLRHMCRIKLKYNGSLSNNIDGCLSFILWTRGQPVGQLWIEEDQQQESFSQKIQLTNSSLRVEHSLRSKIKNLSIDARVLFRNSQIDTITLSNLNVLWKGPCPKHRSIITPFSDIGVSQSTLEDDLMTLTSEDFSQTSTLTTNDRFESSQDHYFIQSTTVKLDKKMSTQRSISYINQSNIGWILSLIVLFCLLVILSSFIYGLWTIQGHYRFIWYVPFDSPIQFLGRRSIRSSTRSENKIGTLSQICDDLLHKDLQQQDFDTFTTNSDQSISSAFHSYF